MILFLIRHAQSANNALPEDQRVEDPALTELGQQQAEALGRWLANSGLTRLVTSPFRRSLQTAERIHRHSGLNAEIWTELHEQGGCYAGWEPTAYIGRPGMSRVEIEADYPHWTIDPAIDHSGWWKCQTYESDEQARARARRLISRTRESFARTNEVVAYVMHADFKRMFLQELFADTLARHAGWPMRIYNTAVSAIEITPHYWRLDQYNSTGHLPFDIRSW